MAEQTTDVKAREITITRMLDAPRELVFDAFTVAEHIARWWGPEGFGVSSAESDPRPGGAFAIVMTGPDGAEYPMRGVYREVERPERLVAESTAVDGDGRALLEAVTTVTLADRDGQTEITLHARAIALVPEAAPMLGGMEAGWRQSLRCLDDALTGAVERQIVLTRMLQAPRERVFEAFTTRDQVERWWGPDGTDSPNPIASEELSPPELIVSTHPSPGADDPSFRTTVALDEMMGMTVLTMKMVFESAEARDLAVERNHAIEGGNETLGRLEAFLSGAEV